MAAFRNALGRGFGDGWPWPILPLLALPFLLTGALASLSPDLATVGAGALLLLWPGYALAEWAGWERGLSRVQRVPLWLALSLLLALLPTLVVTGLHLTVRAFNGFHLALAACLALAVGLRRRRKQDSEENQAIIHPHPRPLSLEGRGETIPSPPRGEGGVRRGLHYELSPLLYFALMLILSLFTFVAVRNGPRDSDSLSYLGHIQERLASAHLEPRDPFLGLDEWTVMPRLWLSPWLFVQAGIADLARVDPVNLVFVYLPPWLALISLASFYGLARSLLSRGAAFFAVGLQMLLYVSSLQTQEGPGRAFFARLAEDKMLMWLVLLPLALRYGLCYLDRGARADYMLYALMAAIVTVVHPLGLVLVGLFAGSMVVIQLLSPYLPRSPSLSYKWGREGVQGVGEGQLPVWPYALALLVPPLLLAPYVFSLRSAERSVPFDVVGSGPTLDFRLALSADRLLILPNGWYLAHPALLRNGLILAGLVLALWAARDLSRSLAARFLFATTFVPLALIYNPLTAPILGRIISPWLLWRITWLPPFTLAAAYAVWRARRIPRLALVIGLLVAFLLSDPVSSYLVWKGGNIWLPPLDRAFVTAASPYIRDDSVILAPVALNRLIPAMLPRAWVIEFRGSPQVPGRRADVEAFYAQEELQGAQLAILRRYGVNYVILPTRGPLAFGAAHLPSLLRPLYQDATWTLYAVPALGAQADPATARTILADLVFWLEDAERALEIYGQALGFRVDATATNLANAEALRARGDLEGALAAYQAMAAAAQATGDAGARAEATARAAELASDLRSLADAAAADGDPWAEAEGPPTALLAQEYWRRARAAALAQRIGDAQTAMYLAARATDAARAAYRRRWLSLQAEGRIGTAQLMAQQLVDFEEQVEKWSAAVTQATLGKDSPRLPTRPAQSVATLADALARSPSPYREMGDYLVGQGEWAEAVGFYDRALVRSPENATLWAILARAADRWLDGATLPTWARNEVVAEGFPQMVHLEPGATYLYAATIRNGGGAVGAALRWEYLLDGEAILGGEQPLQGTAALSREATVFTVPAEVRTFIISPLALTGDVQARAEDVRLVRLPLRARVPIVPNPYVRLGDLRLARGDAPAAALAYGRALAAEPADNDALRGLDRALSQIGPAGLEATTAAAVRQSLESVLNAMTMSLRAAPEDEGVRRALAVAADLYLDAGGILSGPNLIASPGFAGRGWQVYNPDRGARYGVASSTSSSQERGGFIASDVSGYHGGYYQYRKVEGGAVYLFAFSLRTEDTKDLTVKVGNWDYEWEGGRIGVVAGPTLSGSTPWTRYRFLAHIPSGVRGVSFYPVVFFHAGRIWLDDVRVVKLPARWEPPPPP
jgi:tetratricopeptide (TPR) repeat protein